MDQRWKATAEFGDRLRWARLQSPWADSASGAAESLGIKPGTYRSYERLKADGGKVPPLIKIQAIARKFKVSWDWLASGNGDPTPDAQGAFEPQLASVRDRLAEVDESKQEDAMRAVIGVLESYRRRA